MATKNIFAGTGTKTTFVNIIYGELMKREFVTLADILCIYHKREKGYYEKMSCCSETGYGELKKAFPEVVKELRNVYPESVEDNGKIGKGRAYRYVGKDDDPLAEERKVVADEVVRELLLQKSGVLTVTEFRLLPKQVQKDLIRDVMIEIGSGPRQMSRVSGMSYNIIQYMWKNNEEQ